MGVLLFLAALTGCSGPALEAFNDRGGVIRYHMVNSSMADVLSVAESYCEKLGRKAKLGTASIGMAFTEVPFECVE
jgi:hypothetical protein